MPEKDWAMNLQLAEQLRKHNLCFVMHEIKKAFFGKAFGFSMPVSRVNQNTAACNAGHLLRKTFPHGDRAEAFVEHNDGGISIGGWMEQSLQAFAIHGQVYGY